MTSLVAQALDQVARHAGLVFRDVRLLGATQTVSAWLARHDIRDALQIVPGAHLDRLLEELVVHESYFDRDLEQLTLVDELVFSELERTAGQRRIWSAGCAAGEEPYTLAFMLARRNLLPRVSILGTDLSRPALARARAGKYRGWSVRTGAASPAMRFLQRSGPDLCVPDDIRSAVQFRPLNLLTDPYPADQHLVTCRNVLIYFDKVSIAVIAQKLAAALSPEGWLFVAPSDPRLDPHAALTPVVTDRGIYYRRADAAPPIALRQSTPPARASRATQKVLPPPPPRPPPPVRAPARTTVAPPAVPASARGRAGQLADRGDYAGARQELAAAIAASPLDAELHYFAAVLASDIDVPGAIRELERAIYLDPDAPLSYVFIARLHQMRGNLAAARRAYRSALRILDQLAADARVPWTDESVHILSAACRASLGALDE